MSKKEKAAELYSLMNDQFEIREGFLNRAAELMTEAFELGLMPNNFAIPAPPAIEDFDQRKLHCDNWVTLNFDAVIRRVGKVARLRDEK